VDRPDQTPSLRAQRFGLRSVDAQLDGIAGLTMPARQLTVVFDCTDHHTGPRVSTFGFLARERRLGDVNPASHPSRRRRLARVGSRGVLIALLVVGGPDLGWVGLPSAAAHPMFCGNHEEYRTPPHVEGDIYKTACAIPRRLCQSPLVEAARPHEPHLVPRTIRSTAWMTPCDFEQGRGSSDLAAGHHRTSSPPGH
jgi:hypothetical protein